MGNCFRHQSSTRAGKASGSPAHERPYRKATQNGSETEEKILEEKKSVSSFTEVKIKITKKQLEELLRRHDIQGLSLEQILAQLVKVSDEYQTKQRLWRPALHSIPECIETVERDD